jgi:mono/diheme cytochrome c family protein
MRSVSAAMTALAPVLLVLVVGARAQNVSGEQDYRVACAACHGLSGRGDGPVATELRAAPPDLTLLATKNGGTFPAKVVQEIIDGRRSMRAHGSHEMPVWGSIFAEVQKDRAEARISDIVAYVRSIQAH